MRSRMFFIMASFLIMVYSGVFFAQTPTPTPCEPLAYWKFNEGRGTIANDSSGNGNTGELIGASWAPGVSGSSIYFDSGDEYCKVIRNSTLEPIESITVELWAKVESSSGSCVDLLRKAGAWEPGYHIRWSRDYSNIVEFIPPDGDVGSVRDVKPNIEYLHRWHYFVGTYDSSTRETNLYVDGSLINSSVGTGSMSYTADLYMGFSPYPVQGWFAGQLDEVKIWPYVRPENEIWSTYQQYKPITPIPTLTPTPTPWAEISVPSGLQAFSGADNIKLTWDPNIEAAIAGYNIYRSSTDGGTYSKVNTSVVTNPEYTDSGLSLGDTFYYKITAVSTSALESDQTNSVHATVGSIVVWMPDYRGNAGDEVTLMINATNATGISNSGLDVKLTYDTDLLMPVTQSDAGKETVEKTALTNGFLTFDNSTVASGQLNISGVGSEMTITGDGHLFDVKFVVQSDVTPGEYCEHVFVTVKLYDDVPTALIVDYTDTAVFTVAADYIRGDINGDGDVDSADSILALKIATGEITPTWLQQQAGDINGDGVIDSADAILILRLAVGLPVNPP